MRNTAFVSGLIVAVLAVAGGCNSSSSRIADGPNTVTFAVDGMACANCAAHIAEELREIPGVKDAEVDFASKTARVALKEQSPTTRAQLNAAVAQWKKEHFAAAEDPECLDPAKRDEIKRQQAK